MYPGLIIEPEPEPELVVVVVLVVTVAPSLRMTISMRKSLLRKDQNFSFPAHPWLTPVQDASSPCLSNNIGDGSYTYT